MLAGDLPGEVGQQASAACSKWVTDRNGATVRVKLQ
jgi:hypothetical protein